MTGEAFKSALSALGLTQREVASEWGFAEATVSRWTTGRTPSGIPGWVRYALAGVELIRLKKLAKDRGYPWPPVGYS